MDNMSLIKDVPIEISLHIGSRIISLQDLIDINIGSLIELDTFAGEECSIYANGKKIGTGDVVVINERYGVRISALSVESDNKKYIRHTEKAE